MGLFSFLIICVFVNVFQASSMPAQLSTTHLTNNVLSLQSLQNNASALLASTNVTQLRDLPKVVCLNLLGRDLVPASCRNALSKIPQDYNPMTFGLRGRGSFDVPLPFRYLSDDGHCAIDILPADLGVPDAANWRQIALAASLAIGKCVERPSNPTGGIGYTGAHRGLSVRVRSSATIVQCTEHRYPLTDVPPYASCKNVLAKMPWSLQPQVFGPPNQPDVQVGLPAKLPSDDLKCWLFLYSRDSILPGRPDLRDVEEWSEIWAAAVAVNEMCFKQGLLGTALGLGVEKRLHVTFAQTKSPPIPPSPSAQLIHATATADVATV